MSGTSLDGIDAAVIKTDGESITFFGPFESKPYSLAFKNRLRAEFGNKIVPRDLEEELTHLHSDFVKEIYSRNGLLDEKIDVIGFHGQTIFHDPRNKFTLQIGNGELLADLLDCTVVNNFRSADIAAGGEGG